MTEILLKTPSGRSWGFEIHADAKRRCVVKSVVEGSAAEKQGVKVGDRIVGIGRSAIRPGGLALAQKTLKESKLNLQLFVETPKKPKTKPSAPAPAPVMAVETVAPTVHKTTSSYGQHKAVPMPRSPTTKKKQSSNVRPMVGFEQPSLRKVRPGSEPPAPRAVAKKKKKPPAPRVQAITPPTTVAPPPNAVIKRAVTPPVVTPTPTPPPPTITTTTSVDDGSVGSDVPKNGNESTTTNADGGVIVIGDAYVEDVELTASKEDDIQHGLSEIQAARLRRSQTPDEPTSITSVSDQTSQLEAPDEDEEKEPEEEEPEDEEEEEYDVVDDSDVPQNETPPAPAPTMLSSMSKSLSLKDFTSRKALPVPRAVIKPENIMPSAEVVEAQNEATRMAESVSQRATDRLAKAKAIRDARSEATQSNSEQPVKKTLSGGLDRDSLRQAALDRAESDRKAREQAIMEAQAKARQEALESAKNQAATMAEKMAAEQAERELKLLGQKKNFKNANVAPLNRRNKKARGWLKNIG
eukprot:m.219282 g.219282  ORF g.219282 m.219282 type:complete len:523 (+) comp33291_c8_seq2:183-1751(+)